MKNKKMTGKRKYKEIVNQGKVHKLTSSAIAYYDSDGKPVYKRRLPDTNILTKRGGGDTILFIVMTCVFALHCLSLFVPIFWVLISSFKEIDEFLFAKQSFAMPMNFWGELSNYAEAFSMIQTEEANFPQMLFNSVWYTALNTAMHVFCPTITAYVISKYTFVGRNFLYGLSVTILTIPIVGTGGSMLRLVGNLGIYDTPWFVFFTGLAGFTGTFIIYYGYFRSVSWSYAEAAQIDGANPFVVFFIVMLPQAKPIMLTYAITMSISNWGNYTDMLLYLPSYPTVASGLYVAGTAIDRFSGGDTPVYYAGLLMSAVPAIILFSIFSGKILTSISLGGLKG